MPLSRLYDKPRSATKVRSFPVKVSTMDADMKFDDIEVVCLVYHNSRNASVTTCLLVPVSVHDHIMCVCSFSRNRKTRLLIHYGNCDVENCRSLL